jgi:AsmA protein
MRKWIMIAGGVVLAFIVVIAALAIFVNPDRFRPDVEKQASASLGRQVTIGKLKLALFSGGVTAEDLAIADDPQFSKGQFLTAGSMTIGVNLSELIFHRKLDVHSFTIHKPTVTLIQDDKGQWNYASLAKSNAAPSTPAQPSSAPPEFTIGKFTLDDGQVSVHHLVSGKTSEYSKLRFEATTVSLTSSFPYEFSTVAPGGGTVDVKGNFGPIAQESERTPIESAISIKGFDIAATGFSDPSSPLKGVLDIVGHIKSDGTRSDLDANITGNKMCLAAGCTPSTVPIAIHITAGYLLVDRVANISSGQIKLGSSTTNLAGTVNLKGSKPQVNARVDAASLAVGDIEKFLPALGVVLPPGAKLEGGTASVHATVVGPADALFIKGHVGLANSKLTGYDLGDKLSVVTHLTGVTVNKETVIQEFSADVQQSPAGSKVDNLLLFMPGLAKLTGAGTVGQQNDLNFAMKAQVDITKSAVGMVGSALGKKNTSVGIPFHITGTTKDPKFTPDFGNAMGVSSAGSTIQKTTQGLTGKVGGLFGKKK